jgi:DNA-binding NarL/FixJ family response regulator
MHPSENKTAVVVDRFPLWLEALDFVLSRLRVTVVGRTTSAAEGFALVREHEPDVLITDIETGEGEDALSDLHILRAEIPKLKCIVLSAYDDAEHIERALDAGAIAYVVKTVHPDDFAAAIRQAFEHSIYLAGALTTPASVHAAPPPTAAALAAPAADDWCGLTRRELEILQLVAEGHSNAQLARMLWVTEQTVKFHLSNIYRKLDVANRTEASRWAQLRGLLPATATAGIAG